MFNLLGYDLAVFGNHEFDKGQAILGDRMAQADALVVVAHMGTDDRGPYEGLVTIARALIDAGKPVDLMIGGHQRQALPAPVYVGDQFLGQHSWADWDSLDKDQRSMVRHWTAMLEDYNNG